MRLGSELRDGLLVLAVVVVVERKTSQAPPHEVIDGAVVEVGDNHHYW
jgi:hypothetical protein